MSPLNVTDHKNPNPLQLFAPSSHYKIFPPRFNLIFTNHVTQNRLTACLFYLFAVHQCAYFVLIIQRTKRRCERQTLFWDPFLLDFCLKDNIHQFSKHCESHHHIKVNANIALITLYCWILLYDNRVFYFTLVIVLHIMLTRLFFLLIIYL